MNVLYFQVNVLYLNTDNTLADCMDVENTNLKENDVVQDYKKLAKKKQVGICALSFCLLVATLSQWRIQRGFRGLLEPPPHPTF